MTLGNFMSGFMIIVAATLKSGLGIVFPRTAPNKQAFNFLIKLHFKVKFFFGQQGIHDILIT